MRERSASNNNTDEHTVGRHGHFDYSLYFSGSQSGVRGPLGVPDRVERVPSYMIVRNQIDLYGSVL